MRFLFPLVPLLLAGAPPTLELVTNQRIWNQAPHSAFGDIIRFKNQWFVVFREGKWHVAKPGQEDDGTLRVIRSRDGEHWESAALITEKGIDLRDPHLSITGDNRLMIVAGGSEYPNGEFKGRQPRVVFSPDGTTWSRPQAVLERGHWLWRVTWHKGQAYGVSKYGSPSAELAGNPRRQNLVTSRDGIHWQTVAELKVPGGDETTVRFLPDGRMVALMRCSAPSNATASIGVASPPYKEWKWSKAEHFIGGPNFIVLPSGQWIAGGRLFLGGDRKNPKTTLAHLTETSYTPLLQLPSGGDNSYPGFAYHDGLLWTLYYSSHEANTGIYLAKLKVR